MLINLFGLKKKKYYEDYTMELIKFLYISWVWVTDQIQTLLGQANLLLELNDIEKKLTLIMNDQEKIRVFLDKMNFIFLNFSW